MIHCHFVMLKYQVLYLKLLQGNFRDKIFRDFCVIYENHKNIRPWKLSYIKTHDSESRGQEEAGRTRRTSELFTCSTALKFVNALNTPP